MNLGCPIDSRKTREIGLLGMSQITKAASGCPIAC
jgi:hypothetical protein